MTCSQFKIWLSCAVLALSSVACADGGDAPEPFEEGAVFYPTLRLGVSGMTMNESSRAISPMSPDIENYIKTAALFEFDNEGLHQKNSSNYHFIDFTKGTVDGVPGENMTPAVHGVREAFLDGIALEARSAGTICMVVNVTENQVEDFYNQYREDGQSYGSITFDMFKTWALPFDYEVPSSGGYDESVTGHLKTMYMFGYYQGAVDPANPHDVSIDLGRLASRLDITIINETGTDIEKRFGYHLDQVCTSAFFFPLKMGLPPSDEPGLARTVVCSGVGDPVEGDTDQKVPETFKNGDSHMRYFYVAAHSAMDYNEATKLHLFYDSRILEDPDPNAPAVGVQVPLCNVNPLEAANVANGYSLSRNTRYHFIIRLKSRSQVPSRSGQMTQNSYEYTSDGINVYLPV